jgi:hypothetical protein
MSEFYTLDDNKNAIKCSLQEWGKLYTRNGSELRRVAIDKVGDYRISTVFLGIDHNLDSDQPHIFETMIFGPESTEVYTIRCSTWHESEKMHEDAIQWVKDGCKDE